MKKIRPFSSIVILSLIIGFTSCSKEDTELVDNSLAEEVEITDTFNSKSTSVILVETPDLTQDEIDGLYWMREEEKLAMDVYDLFYETYGLRIFDNISDSELSHTTAVLRLINFYGLEDPALVTAGLFSDSNLQELYDALVLQGSTSIDALLTGALIEEVDIIDLEEEMVQTSNVNLIAVYENLLEGSKRHLVAFVRNLEMNGVTYVPQKLDAAVYEEILATTTTGGNGNKNRAGNNGKGNAGGANGNGGGNGHHGGK